VWRGRNEIRKQKRREKRINQGRSHLKIKVPVKRQVGAIEGDGTTVGEKSTSPKKNGASTQNRVRTDALIREGVTVGRRKPWANWEG